MLFLLLYVQGGMVEFFRVEYCCEFGLKTHINKRRSVEKKEVVPNINVASSNNNRTRFDQVTKCKAQITSKR